MIILGIMVLGIIVFFVSKNIKKTAQVISAWGIYEVYNSIFDFILWPTIQNFYGWRGIIFLILVAMTNNFLILRWYSKKKVDWFGVDVLADIKEKGHVWARKVSDSKNTIKKISLYIPAKILHFLIWLLNKNDIFAFITLSVWQDSFITTIFLRHNKSDKLNKRDYFIFFSSTLLSCLWWSVLAQVIIIVVKSIIGLF